MVASCSDESTATSIPRLAISTWILTPICWRLAKECSQGNHEELTPPITVGRSSTLFTVRASVRASVRACERARERACERARERARERACERASVRAFTIVYFYEHTTCGGCGRLARALGGSLGHDSRV
jgi:hypothetical protein